MNDTLASAVIDDIPTTAHAIDCGAGSLEDVAAWIEAITTAARVRGVYVDRLHAMARRAMAEGDTPLYRYALAAARGIEH